MSETGSTSGVSSSTRPSGGSSSSSSSSSSESSSQTKTESLQSSPTTAESLADSPTTEDSLSSDSDSNSQGGARTADEAPAQSLDKKSDAALDSISDNLDQSGFLNDVTHKELREINNTLTDLTPDQTNDVVANMSDKQLSTWAKEIDSNALFGAGGLDADEKTSLFNNLASDLNMNQLNRVSNAFNDADSREELSEAIGRTKTTDEVRTAISNGINSLPASADVSNLTNIDNQLEKLQNARTMANLSSDSYKDFADAAGPNTLAPGTTRLDPANMPAELDINKEQMMDEASGFHAAIYKQGEGADAKYVVAFRGTEDGTDWKTNIASGVGIDTKQFNMANALVEQVINDVGRENVTVTGHSLGGGLANYTAMKNEVYSTAFNPKGTTIREKLEIKNENALADKYIQNYSVDGELLTGLQETIPVLMMEAPGQSTEIPAIKPDGQEGNMWLEGAKELIMKLNPFQDSDDNNISGPVDRHGMDYVLRGMDASIDRLEGAALNELSQAQN